MTHKIIRGKEVASPILDDVKSQVTKLKRRGWMPRLASLEIGNNPAAGLYIRNQKRICDQVGIEFENRKYDVSVTQQEMMAAIQSMNVDPRISGIILQRPVPRQLDLNQLQSSIHPTKDVEGMSPANIGKIVYGEFDLGPCTALASVEILKSTGVELRGLDVVIVGHSEIVGKRLRCIWLRS